MSVVFGDPAELAIEAKFTGWEGKWCLGSFRLFVGGSEYGDFSDTVDLAAGSRWGRVFLEHSRDRMRPDLDQKSASEVYEEVFGRFMEGRGEGLRFDRDTFLFDDIGDSSLRDTTCVLVVRRADGHERVILRDLATARTEEVIVGPWTCDRAVRAFCSWVDSLDGGGDT